MLLRCNVVLILTYRASPICDQIRDILHTSKRMEERDLLLRLSTGGTEERTVRLKEVMSEEVSNALGLESRPTPKSRRARWIRVAVVQLEDGVRVSRTVEPLVWLRGVSI